MRSEPVDPLDPDGTGLPNMRTVTLDELMGRNTAAEVLQRLHDHAMGRELMTKTEVTAATVVLRKLVPDLAQTAITGKDGGPVLMQAVVNVAISG